MSDNDWLGAQQAQDYVGRTDRQLRRWASSGKVRTRKRGGRVEYSRADLDAIRGTMDEEPAPRNTQIVPAGELMGYVRELQEQLQQSAAREGYLRAQLDQRLALTDERALREELAAERQHKAAIEAEIKRLQGSNLQFRILAIVLAVLLIGAIVWYLFIR